METSLADSSGHDAGWTYKIAAVSGGNRKKPEGGTEGRVRVG